MDTVLPLKFVSKLVVVQTLFKHLDEPESESLSEYITSLLETDCFTAVSEEILLRITKYFPEKLDNRLLRALLPAHAKELNLSSCHHVTLMGLVNVLKKCSHIQKLNLSGCTQLMIADIFTCMGLMSVPVTTICVEGNQNVTDEIVQTMIKLLPKLHNLDISCCNQVTDDVFLVEKDLQLRRETSKRPLTGHLSEYKYQLSSVDISGCGGITSVAVRHLTSLSGPYLRHVNISCTKIDSTALFTLAGYSFPAIIDFVLNGDESLVKEKELKEYVADLTEIADVYGFPVKHKEEVVTSHTEDEDPKMPKSTGEESSMMSQDICDEHGSQTDEMDLHIDETPHVIDTGFEVEAVKINSKQAEDPINTVVDECNLETCSAENEFTNTETVLDSSVDSKTSYFSVLTESSYYETATSESDSEFQDKVQSLSLKESAVTAGQNSDFINKVFPESKLLVDLTNTASIEQDDLKEPVSNMTDEVNRNDNGQNIASYETSVYSENSLIQRPKPPKTLVNNYVENDKDTTFCETLLADSDNRNLLENPGWTNKFVDGTEESCVECCNSKEFSDNVAVPSKNLHSDLNKNLVCDSSENNDVFANHLDNKLPENFVKPCPSCTAPSDSISLREIENDSRYEMDLEQNIKDSSDSISKSVEHDFAITMVAQCNLPKDCEVLQNLGNEDISVRNENVNDSDINFVSEKNGYMLDSPDDVEKAALNETDDSVDSKQQKMVQFKKQIHVSKSDHGNLPGHCDKCKLIREKIHSSISSDNIQVAKRIENNASNSELESGCGQTHGVVGENHSAHGLKDDIITSVENRLDNIERAMDTIDRKLSAFKRTDEQTIQLYTPHLTSLNIENIKFPSTLLGKLCLEKFFQLNKELRVWRINWKGLTEKLMKTLVPSLSNLQEISVEECPWLQNGGVATMGKCCPNLRKVNLRGVVFIKDMAMVPYLVLPELTSLDLAESELTDATLIRLANRCFDRLTELDLSWCEEITERGVNEICSKCTKLEVLTLKRCPVSDITLSLMAENCRLLRDLTIESVEDVTTNVLSDVGISEIGQSLRYLQKLDISWNLSITDVSVNVIMSQGILLEEAYMKGLKQITGEAFLPIIADFLKWQKCQALLKFKRQEREYLQEQGEEQCSSDEEYESLMIPHRSTSYAPNLRVLDLEYSDLVEDERMMEIVSVCRGSLKVIDYYGQELKPRLFIKK